MEPIGGLHAEVLAAQLMALLANANFKRSRPFAAAEFMPFHPPAPVDPMAEAAALRASLDAYQKRRSAAT